MARRNVRALEEEKAQLTMKTERHLQAINTLQSELDALKLKVKFLVLKSMTLELNKILP